MRSVPTNTADYASVSNYNESKIICLCHFDLEFGLVVICRGLRSKLQLSDFNVGF